MIDTPDVILFKCLQRTCGNTGKNREGFPVAADKPQHSLKRQGKRRDNLPPDAPGLFRAGLWLIAGGGLGNLYDRLAYGRVIDFLEPAFVRFAVFNVADVCVCVGAALAMLSVVLGELRGRKSHGG